MSKTEIPQTEQNEFLNLLSPNTQKLYGRIKQHIEHRKLTEAWYYDYELSRRCGVPPSQLDRAKSELSRSGLMTVIPGTVQTKFVLRDEPDFQ